MTTFNIKGLSLINFLAFTLKDTLNGHDLSIKAIFKIFCLNGEDTISVESMVCAFNKSYIKINQKQVDSILTKHNIDVKTGIDFEQFKCIIASDDGALTNTQLNIQNMSVTEHTDRDYIAVKGV